MAVVNNKIIKPLVIIVILACCLLVVFDNIYLYKVYSLSQLENIFKSSVVSHARCGIDDLNLPLPVNDVIITQQNDLFGDCQSITLLYKSPLKGVPVLESEQNSTSMFYWELFKKCGCFIVEDDIASILNTDKSSVLNSYTSDIQNVYIYRKYGDSFTSVVYIAANNGKVIVRLYKGNKGRLSLHKMRLYFIKIPLITPSPRTPTTSPATN